jgi:hypothetical protein
MTVTFAGKPRAILIVGFAVLLVVASGLVFSLCPVTFLRCSRSPAQPGNCSVEYRIAGIYTLHDKTLSGVLSVEMEEDVRESRSEHIGERTTFHTTRYSRLVMRSDSAMMATEWIGYPIGSSCGDMLQDLSAFLEQTQGERFFDWQAEAAPNLLGLTLFMLSVFALLSGLKGLRQP